MTYEVVGKIVEDGNVWSAVSAVTGWSPQFTNRSAAVEWLKKRGVKVEGELYPTEKKPFWRLLLFWK